MQFTFFENERTFISPLTQKTQRPHLNCRPQWKGKTRYKVLFQKRR